MRDGDADGKVRIGHDASADDANDLPAVPELPFGAFHSISCLDGDRGKRAGSAGGVVRACG
ncbi:MAG: hypothetical protein WA802_02670 [Terracidiphilus sp.]